MILNRYHGWTRRSDAVWLRFVGSGWGQVVGAGCEVRAGGRFVKQNLSKHAYIWLIY